MTINSPFPRAGFLFCLVALAISVFASPAQAQENPYIVTYDHYLEEPGSLEVEYFSTFGTQRAGNDFHAYWAEFEYGATAWWTTSCTLTAKLHSTTAPSSPAFVGKTVSACSSTSTLSIQFSIS